MKRVLGAGALSILLAAGAAETPAAFPRATPESQGVSSEAVMKLIDRLEAEGDMVHSYMLVRHGKVVAEGWWAPYDAKTRHALYSVSKSFVSMAIAYAVEDRLMTLNDRVNWFFPWLVPANQDERAKEMRIRDLLSMASGQKHDSWGAMLSAPRGQQAKAFFSVPMEEPPGLLFRYMSGNTAMLAQIHRRVTREPDLVEYLKPRVFDKLGISDMDWLRQPDGTVLGGSGFELTTEDLAKVGQLLLQGGRWNGERLLPLWWVKQATSCQTPYGDVLDPVLAHHMGKRDAQKKGPSDWEVGYGYQLWMGNHETFRLCGAFGQICIVMPDEDLVFTSNAGGDGANMHSVEAFFDTILPGLSKTALPENPSAQKALRARSAALSITPGAFDAKPSARAKAVAAKGFEIKVDEEELRRGLRQAKTEAERDALLPPLRIFGAKFDADTNVFSFTNSFGSQSFRVGTKGVWEKGEAELEGYAPVTLSRIREGVQPLGATGGWKTDGVYGFRVCFTRTPFILDFTLDCTGEEMKLACACRLSKRYTFGQAEKAGGDGIDVVAVYYPHWHKYPKGTEWFGEKWDEGEWAFVKTAVPRYPGHRVPIQPLPGYLNGRDPKDVATEIALASNAGIDVFLYDYYYYCARFEEICRERGIACRAGTDADLVAALKACGTAL